MERERGFFHLLFIIILIRLVAGSLAYESKNSDNDDYDAYCDPDNWYIYTVDSNVNIGFHTSIAVDSKGNPHISYFDYKLKYAKDDGDIEEYAYYLKHATKTSGK